MPPTVVNSIGSYQFLALRGALAPHRQQLEKLTWPGVDFADYRFHGQRSQPFTLQSVVNVDNIGAGISLMKNYAATIGIGLLALTYRGVNLYTSPYLLGAAVLDVQQVEVSRVVAWCNSYDDTDTAKLVANWVIELRAL